MSESNPDYRRWDIKPVWFVTLNTRVDVVTYDALGAEVVTPGGLYRFEVLGLNRSAIDIAKNWEKIHSVEQFNQGRVSKPSDFTITLAVKENGNAYEALRRIAVGGLEFDVSCDLIQGVPNHQDSQRGNIWMKGFEAFLACVVTRASQTIEIGEVPVREFECDALRHSILGYNDLEDLIEGDGTYQQAAALTGIDEFFDAKIPPAPTP